jgi:hypothetical protein
LFAPPVLKRQKDFTFIQRKLILEANILQLETEGVTVYDSSFNRSAWLSSIIWLNGLGCGHE